MEATIENITSLMAIGNLAVNQLMEREAVEAIITKATSPKEPEWITVMTKNMRQVVNRAMETLVDMPK
jgi:hypothetical protein